MKLAYNYNWREIIKRAWSIRFMAVSAVCNGALVIVAVAPDMLPKKWWIVGVIAIASIVFSLLGMWARLVAQKGLGNE